MDTQTQIDRLIELAIIQRSELKQLVEQLPQLREHLNAEVEKVFDETEPQLRAELEEWTTKQTADKTAALGVALEAKIADLAKSLEVSTQARYNAIIAEREENARLAAQAEAKIAEHSASLPSAVKDIVTAELARFPRAGEIDQLRKEFAEPRGLNPRGKWQAGETYNKLDLVTINGDSYTSNTDGNRTRPSRSSADWTLVAARGTGGGGGPTSLSELTTVPSDGDVLIGSGTSWVTSNLTAGAGISITVGPGAITISATDGDITLDDGTAASPSLHFTNDADTGIYRPAANTLGISVSGTQVAYFDENGLTVPSAGVVAGGSIHAGNGNANNPSLSFDGDQDTGFFRHQPNEIGIALGGTQYATLTSTTFSITPVVTMASSLRVNGTTDSSSKDTGAIVTEGGLGVEKSATIGGNLTVSGGTATLGSDASLVRQGNGWVQIANTSGSFAFGGYSVTTNRTDNYVGLRAINNTGGTSFGEFGVGSTATGDGLQNYGYIFTGAGLNGIRLFTNGSTTAKLTIDNAGLTTLGGNLTVSGTQMQMGGVNPFIQGTTGAGYIQFQNAGDVVVASNTGKLVLIANGSTRATVSTNGNVLIGTTTDGGQKLQVAGTVYFSGDLYSNTAGSTWGADSGATGFLVYGAGGGGNANKLVFRTNSTTALTLDSSQNATFAGNYVYVGGGTSFYLRATGSGNGLWYGNNVSVDIAGSFSLRNQAGTVTNASIDSSGNATFAGTISQTQAAAGSTANLKLGELGIREWGFYATGGKMSIRPSSAGTWSFNGNTDVELLRTTASTSTTTGALIVSGGVGVAGAVNVGTYYGMVDGVTAPAATSGYAKIYVDTADGDLKVIFGDGTIKTIATDT